MWKLPNIYCSTSLDQLCSPLDSNNILCTPAVTHPEIQEMKTEVDFKKEVLSAEKEENIYIKEEFASDEEDMYVEEEFLSANKGSKDYKIKIQEMKTEVGGVIDIKEELLAAEENLDVQKVLSAEKEENINIKSEYPPIDVEEKFTSANKGYCEQSRDTMECESSVYDEYIEITEHFVGDIKTEVKEIKDVEEVIDIKEDLLPTKKHVDVKEEDLSDEQAENIKTEFLSDEEEDVDEWKQILSATNFSEPSFNPKSCSLKNSRQSSVVSYSGEKCFYRNCKNSKKNAPTLRFFQLPKSKLSCKRWLQLGGRNECLKPSEIRHYKFCENHFETNSISSEGQLKKRALPLGSGVVAESSSKKAVGLSKYCNTYPKPICSTTPPTIKNSPLTSPSSTAPPEGKRKMFLCRFCNKYVLRFQRHILSHKNVEEVQVILSKEKDERKRLIDILKYSEKFSQEGQVLVAKEDTKDTRQRKLPCPTCKKLIRSTNLQRHLRNIHQEKVEGCVLKAKQIALSVKTLKFTSTAVDELLGGMMTDPLLEVIINDEAILRNAAVEREDKYSSVDHLNMVRRRMREAASILQYCRSKNPSITDCLSMLKSEHFDLFLEAVKNVGSFKNGVYEKPSIAMYSGYSMMRIAEFILKWKKADKSLINDVRDWIQAYKNKRGGFYDIIVKQAKLQSQNAKWIKQEQPDLENI